MIEDKLDRMIQLLEEILKRIGCPCYPTYPYRPYEYWYGTGTQTTSGTTYGYAEVHTNEMS